MKSFYFLLLVPLLIFISCREPVIPERLDSVLALAGENKNELVKTIQYFQDKGDSLQLQAAYFLIENMEDKYSYTGESYKNLIERVESFSPDTAKDAESLKKAKDNIDNELAIYSTFTYAKIPDASIITSDFLVEHIEGSFRTLEFPWIKGKISFQQFCRYILPYKVGNEPIEYWRTTITKDYLWLLDSLTHIRADLVTAAKIINDEIAKHIEPRGASKVSLHFGYNHLKKIGVGSCMNAVTFTLYVMRTLGIPTEMDFSPQWGNRSGGHEWTVLYNPNGETVPFDPTYEFKYFSDRFHPKTNRKVLPPKYAVTAKIFSVPFAKREFLYSGDESVPHVFKRNLPDVTEHYTKVRDIHVPLHPGLSNQKHGYLFVFDTKSWIPVQISENGFRDTLVFKKMGNNVVYLPGCISSQEVVTCGYPFVYNDHGERKVFVPQRNNRRTIILSRKYPYLERVISFAERMMDGEFQVSNDPDFKNVQILYKVAKIPGPYFQEVKIRNKNTFRYFRYVPADSCYGDIAEIEIYTSSEKNPFYGSFLGTKGESMACAIEKAFDGDKLTYYTSLKPSGSWIGMDFGKEIRIEKIRFLPRNDQNTIEPGDDYELFYWDNTWVSLGVQKAEKHFLEYSVPENALLWLRNLTRGKEERIFSYEKGKQIWW